MHDLERIARFSAPDAVTLPDGLSEKELRKALADAPGPPELAGRLHAGLSERHHGEVSSFTATAGHMAHFAVEGGAGRANVLVLWWPVERFWTVGVFPGRGRWRGRRVRDRDTALVREVVGHVRDLLARLPDVGDVRWMTDEEAKSVDP